MSHALGLSCCLGIGALALACTDASGGSALSGGDFGSHAGSFASAGAQSAGGTAGAAAGTSASAAGGSGGTFANPSFSGNAGAGGSAGEPAGVAGAAGALPGGTLGELARPADSLLDMVGVNGHVNYEPSVYTEQFDAAILPRATELGIRNWRDALSPYESVLDRQRRLANVGVRFTLHVSELDIGVTLQAVKQALPQITAVEGPNELDHGFRNGLPAFPGASTRTYQGIGFPGVVAAFQNDLYAAIKGDAATQQLTVLMAGFSFPDNTLDVGLVAGCDCGNTHSYSDGGLPTYRLDDWYIPRAQVNSGPDKPLCSTETGYHTTAQPDGGHWIPKVSERAAGKYQLRLLLEYFNRRFDKVFLYEFADIGLSNEVADLNFGLLRNDGTPKAQFFALKQLLSLLADPGPSFTTTRLDFALASTARSLQHTLLQKRDGTFYLALWLNELSFDRVTQQDTETSESVHLSVRAPSVNLTAYLPVAGEAARYRIDHVGEVDLEVTDQPLLLELAPSLN